VGFNLLIMRLVAIRNGSTFLFRAFWERDMERAWRNSISVLTEPISVWKAERKVSTSLRTLSQFFHES